MYECDGTRDCINGDQGCEAYIAADDAKYTVPFDGETVDKACISDCPEFEAVTDDENGKRHLWCAVSEKRPLSGTLYDVSCKNHENCRIWWISRIAEYTGRHNMRLNGSADELRLQYESLTGTGLAVQGESNSQNFDYSDLDEDTEKALRLRADSIRGMTAQYATQLGQILSEAQEMLADHYKGTFEKWYTSLGLSKKTVYRLLNRYELLSCAPVTQLETLENIPLKLSYAISEPSAPEELVQAVKDGDITTHAEYQRLKKELDEERMQRLAAERDAEESERLAEQRAEVKREALEQLQEANAKIQQLESRPIDVAVHELSEEDVARIRDEARSDYEEQLRLMESRCSQARAEASNQRSRADSLLEQLESRTQSDEAGKGMDYESCCNMAKDFAGTIDAFAKLYIFAAHLLPGDQFLAAAEPALAAAQDMLTTIRAQSTTQDYKEDDFL